MFDRFRKKEVQHELTPDEIETERQRMESFMKGASEVIRLANLPKDEGSNA